MSVINAGNGVFTGTVSVGANVSMNTTQIAIGSPTLAANGWCYLHNGVILQWGWVAANTTTLGQVTFSTAFPTNIFQYGATSNAAAALVAITAANTTQMTVVTAASTCNAHWFAIGN